jgi:CheY-like chemotaxis protein
MAVDVDVLLVEDNPNDEELTLHAMRKYHLTSHLGIVRDGAEALDFLFCQGEYARRADESQPSVILLDLKLPKVDGLEVLKEIRADASDREIPVVILTSSSEVRDIRLGYELGANSYIVKPVDFEHFSETIRSIGMYWLLLNKPPLGGVGGG